MPLNVQATNIDGQGLSLTIPQYPDECPICHTGMFPRFVAASINGANLDIALQCTKRECQSMFIGSYKNQRLSEVKPKTAKPASFSETVTRVSPTFVEIYNQAIAAEAYGLAQVSGIGFRKALEFLVKDFVMSEKPDQKEAILNSMLGPCIARYVDDPNVKACAKLAAWIGNDETHYLRRWEDKDVEDLKLLIRLTVNWIDNVLLTRKYVADMDPPRLPSPG